jgi:catechol 2,3-dioxygenase-like lactoylglutathione lyase family enzyme
MLSAIQWVSLGVSDLERALRLYRGVIGFSVDAEYQVSDTLRAFWSLPSGATGQIVELSSRGYPTGRLRLVALSPTPTTKVRSDDKRTGNDSALDIGPKAIDFYVKPPIDHAIELIERAGYTARSRPIRHEIDGQVSEELLFTGPDDVPLLLMIGHVHKPELLRSGSPEGDFSEIATISIVGGDIARSRAFYRDALGLETLTDAQTAPEHRDLVCDLTGVPRGTEIHWLLYAGIAEPSGKILVVHFGGLSTRRLTGRMHPGHLGFGLLTHVTNDLDAIANRLERGGFELSAVPTQIDLGPRRCRALLVRGPNEELIEIIEQR